MTWTILPLKVDPVHGCLHYQISAKFLKNEPRGLYLLAKVSGFIINASLLVVICRDQSPNRECTSCLLIK
ncbi:hypothetical protein L6452_33281 [Arctium lappa]|uniref:Uncharacterized protein n=1 Tax=Arctium lappa TaxID=4217 RepID=A0ACB8Z7V9_ARCLA|nr:hypothetical protein L6452_33281 [Arctium lappa]